MKLISWVLIILSFILLTPNCAVGKPSTRLKVGDTAPDFSLPDQDGNAVSLKGLESKKTIVLYFYPKDDVGVCKKEACLFRDQYQAFVDAGAEVIGVSSDSVKSHKKFVDRRKLPFKLLSDKHGKVRKLYGISSAVGGLLPGRVTFVIDRQGTVRDTFDSFMHADKHVDEALDVLKKLDSNG